ncbi:peroxiredoxin [Thioalkalivibrio sp. ALE11]|uniref:peroxiredoxin family protein n=1 Tax=Thioalkalivibrio sp. ALE11 TaxID=1265494 RepID=UPI00035DD6C3|nr:TlpA disulfide reductase family protein [Thioalkalivibrio sp. ALE11]
MRPRGVRLPVLRLLPALCLLLLTAGMTGSGTALADSPAATTVTAGGEPVPVQRYPAEHGPVLLWFPSEHGLQDEHRQQALALQARGVEVWLADPFTGHFLPEAASSFDDMPLATVPDLLDAAREETERPVFVFASDRAWPWLLTGLHQWQQANPDSEDLAGVLMLSPFLHTGADAAEPELQPIVHYSNLPVFILQPVQSPQFQHLGRVRAALADAGSSVGVRLLPELRDRYFFRPDATAGERLAREALPGELLRGMDLLARTPSAREPRVPAADVDLAVRTPSGTDARLNPVEEQPDAPELIRPDLAGEEHDLRDYRGEVILINFWASWCPPCVHEMPSMQRLEDELRDEGFRILAVNLGEPEDTIRAFIEDEVQTDFTILLDPQQESLEDWRALAFPTSYVIDREGRVRYALYGAIEWMEPGVIEQIRGLLEE